MLGRILRAVLLPLPLALWAGGAGAGASAFAAVPGPQTATTAARSAERPAAGQRAASSPGDVVPEDVRPPAADMARITAGAYTPLYGEAGGMVEVSGFELDRRPVTNAEYRDFLRANPSWRPSRIKPLFAGGRYLAAWTADLELGPEAAADAPVTDVSWFAARSYCGWRGARLPTADEWEYVARADETRRDATSDAAFRERLLALYTAPRRRPLPEAGSGFTNVWGVSDLHGGPWEWVQDFNNVLTASDSRAGGAQDRQLYCASAANGAARTDDYAAFMRYAFRSSLEGRTTAGNLGFRCARSL